MAAEPEINGNMYHAAALVQAREIARQDAEGSVSSLGRNSPAAENVVVLQIELQAKYLARYGTDGGQSR